MKETCVIIHSPVGFIYFGICLAGRYHVTHGNLYSLYTYYAIGMSLWKATCEECRPSLHKCKLFSVRLQKFDRLVTQKIRSK
jgi:hypothetical protein